MGTATEGGVTGTGEKPAVRAIGDIKPPKLIKLVKPVYPDEAKKAEIEGVVIVEATTDIYGRVVDTKVLRSIPELDQAAQDAVKQWVYEPMIIDGEPRGVIFTVTCTFKLDEKELTIEDIKQPKMIIKAKPVRAVDDIMPPKLIKKVEPVYPKTAKKEGIEGVVIIEATTDEYGRVVSTKILRSIPELNQAAIDAVKQWIYEPKIIDGEPRGVIFTVTVQFKLK
jgi:TonB family protein